MRMITTVKDLNNAVKDLNTVLCRDTNHAGHFFLHKQYGSFMLMHSHHSRANPVTYEFMTKKELNRFIRAMILGIEIERSLIFRK